MRGGGGGGEDRAVLLLLLFLLLLFLLLLEIARGRQMLHTYSLEEAEDARPMEDGSK
jgi:hypothetical protein